MLTREDALAIYDAGPETVVRVLLAMDARIDGLEQQVRVLGVHVRLQRPLRQQPGRTRHTHDEGAAKDLRHVP